MDVDVIASPLSVSSTMFELGTRFLARSNTPLAAYNHLQARLIEHYVAQGHRPEEFVENLAAAFRARYGWMLEETSGR